MRLQTTYTIGFKTIAWDIENVKIPEIIPKVIKSFLWNGRAVFDSFGKYSGKKVPNHFIDFQINRNKTLL